MNTMLLRGSDRHGVELLELVDFKWLMAGQGVWVDLTRWRADADYADACIAAGLCSHCDTLRDCAARLQSEMHELDDADPNPDPAEGRPPILVQ